MSNILEAIGFGSPQQRAFNKLIKTNKKKARESFPALYKEWKKENKEKPRSGHTDLRETGLFRK